MSITRKAPSSSQYYRFSFCGGMEALAVNGHKTPFPAHFHPTFNVSLIYSGTFQTKLHNRLVLAPSGTILITNPQEIHANPVAKDGNLGFFTFYISQDFFNHCNGGRPVYFEHKTIDDAAMFARLHALSLKLTGSKDFHIIEQEFRVTFADLAAAYGTHHSITAESGNPLFQELLVNDHFEKFSLTDAAKALGIDKYKYLRLFKDQTGLTPNNYFIYRRIEKSKTLLAEGHDLLSVAVDLGFYDAAHYANHFKKFTGVSPMNFNTAQ